MKKPSFSNFPDKIKITKTQIQILMRKINQINTIKTAIETFIFLLINNTLVRNFRSSKISGKQNICQIFEFEKTT
jgi:hypothetical protein